MADLSAHKIEQPNIFEVSRRVYSRIWRFRSLIWMLSYRDVVARYKGSILGFFWTLLNPLLLMLTYTIVFRYISRFSVPDYPLYVLLGILIWQYVSGCISESASSVQASSGLITKSPLPPEVIPVKVAVAQGINFLFAFCVYLFFAIVVYQRVSIHMLAIPFLFLLLFVFAVHASIIIALVSVMFRDIQQIVGNVLTILMFTTPILYSYADLPKVAQNLLLLQPISQLVRLVIDVIFWGRIPDVACMLSVAFAILVLAIGSILTVNVLSQRIAEKV